MKLIHIDIDSAANALLGASVGVGSLVTAGINLPFVTLILAALCGSLLGMSISEPVRPRSRMFKIFVVNASIGVVSVFIIPHVPGFKWVGDVPQPAIACLISFVLQWLLLPSIEAAKRTINSIKAGGDK